MNKLISVKSDNIYWDDYYVNDLTKHIKKNRDLQVLKSFTTCGDKDEYNEIVMYPLEHVIDDTSKVSVIRYPGMTIGHVTVNKDHVITEVLIYTAENAGMKFEIVKPEIANELQIYLGRTLVFID